jgi:hypothetical protein
MKTSIPRPLVRANQGSIVLSVILYVLSGSWAWLLIPLISGILSLTTGKHPVMMVAKRFLRKPLSSYVQENKGEQRFNQILAVVLLSGSVISAVLGWTLTSLVLAGLVFMAAFVAMLGFCIGCFIQYQWRQYRYRKQLLTQ